MSRLTSRNHFRKLNVISLFSKRTYKVLAIESSCDDACITLLDRYSRTESPKVIHEEKITLDSASDGGVVPTAAAQHNNRNIALLTQKVLREYNWGNVNDPSSIPDLICATRGPGMVGSLRAGYSIGQGLSIAWNRPFIGVHHMLGHLLIPRMQSNGEKPSFPVLSLLISGGHTMCVLSRDLLDHEIVADTIDIAAGDALDKSGRELGIRGNMIGKEMEIFLNKHREEWGKEVDFTLIEPLLNSRDKSIMASFSFSSFESQVKSSLQKSFPDGIPNDKIRARIIYKVQKTLFNHIIRKIKLTISSSPEKFAGVSQFVCSGGVGSNMTLRNMLSEELKGHGIKDFFYPEIKLCTDNATMIGWAGIELFEKEGLTTEVGTSVIRKWPVDRIKGLDGWLKHADTHIKDGN